MCFASIDIANAFGSVPHEAVIRALECSGAGNRLQNIISLLLKDASTLSFSSVGEHGPEPINCGVRQGDPLSGLLFNFAFNPVILVIFNMLGIKILVYADDELILANSPALLQAALDIFAVLCHQLGLTVNPKKCYTIHLGCEPRECRETTFTLNQVPLTYMLENDPIMFLGKPIGFQIINDHSHVKEFYDKAEAIL